jgi:hypothetical protein
LFLGDTVSLLRYFKLQMLEAIEHMIKNEILDDAIKYTIKGYLGA